MLISIKYAIQYLVLPVHWKVIQRKDMACNVICITMFFFAFVIDGASSTLLLSYQRKEDITISNQSLDQIKEIIENLTCHTAYHSSLPSIIAGATVSVAALVLLTCTCVIIMRSKKLLHAKRSYHAQNTSDQTATPDMELTDTSGDEQLNLSNTEMDNICSSTRKPCLPHTPNPAKCTADTRSTTVISHQTTSGAMKRVKGEHYDTICTYEEIQKYEKVPHIQLVNLH